MTTFLLLLMALSLVAALERNNRRQSLGAPRLHGFLDHDDRDWARISLDLIALGDEVPKNHDRPRTASSPKISGIHRNVA